MADCLLGRLAHAGHSCLGAIRQAWGSGTKWSARAVLPITGDMDPCLAVLIFLWLAWPAHRTGPESSRPPEASLSSIPDAFARPTAALMWPGATRSFLVDSDGSLYNGYWRVDVLASADSTRAAAPNRIWFEDRWRPIAHWSERAGDVVWEFEAVSLPAPDAPFAELRRDVEAWSAVSGDRRARDSERRTLTTADRNRWDHLVVGASRRLTLAAGEDVPMLVSVLVTARNVGHRPHHVSLELKLSPARAAEAWYQGGALRSLPRWGWANSATDSAIAWSSDSPAGRSTKNEAVLQPAASLTQRFIAASHAIPAARLVQWARKPHATRAQESREYWSRETARGTKFKLNDPEVESAVRAARVVLLSCRERRGGHWVPLGNPFQYRDVWLRDGARAIAALSVHGYTVEARALSESFLVWQAVHGPFVSQGAQLDGTGQALWAFGQANLRPKSGSGLSEYTDAAFEAWQWAERIRGRYAGSVSPGLMPPANPQDNEMVAGQLIGTDAWTIAGYAETERLLRTSGRAKEADQVKASLQQYRAEFVSALATTESRDLPPSYKNRGYDWGNLAVAYPCQALPTNSPRLAALADRYWARATRPGLGYWASPDSLHGYVGADLATWSMRAGRRDETERALAALLDWRDASGAACELFTSDGNFGRNLPPHATSAAALLQLVRNCVIDDDGDCLALTQGARERWWRGSRIERAPTRWGQISLTFDQRDRVAHWKWTPVPVWTELTLPPGTVLATRVAPPFRRGSRPDRILVPPGIGEARITTASAR